MTTKNSERVSQELWEAFERRWSVGGVWLELGDQGGIDCHDAIGQGNDVSDYAASAFHNALGLIPGVESELNRLIRESGGFALFAKKPRGEGDDQADIGQLLVDFMGRGEVPEDGLSCGTAILFQGPRESELIDEWLIRILPAAERWASSRRADEQHGNLRKSGYVPDNPGMTERGHTKRDSPPGEVIDLREMSMSPPVAENPVQTRLVPEERERRVLGEFKTYAKENPREAIQWLYGVVRAAEAELPPEHRPTLGLREAAGLISEMRGINLSHTQLRRYFDDPDIEIGCLGPDGKPRFTPAECDVFIPPPPKKTGPKSKIPQK